LQAHENSYSSLIMEGAANYTIEDQGLTLASAGTLDKRFLTQQIAGRS
jgi:hypothetical protein